jgi:Flp pilus assembly protein CpaB
MASGTTRRTSRVTSRTSRAGGGGGVRTSSAMSILVIIILVVAAMAFFIIFLNYKNQQDLAKANKTVPVIVAAVRLEAGRQIQPQDITQKQVKEGSVEPGAITDASDPRLIGGTLVVAVEQGQTILGNYIGVPEEKLLPAEGEREVTIALTGQNARDNFLRKGQIVSVHRVFTTQGGNVISKSLSKSARILDVKKSESLVENAQAGGEAQTDVNLAVSPEDAQKIMAYRDSGQVRILDGANQEPPTTKVSLFQMWNGTEVEEKELTSEVGGNLVSKPTGDKP